MPPGFGSKGGQPLSGGHPVTREGRADGVTYHPSAPTEFLKSDQHSDEEHQSSLEWWPDMRAIRAAIPSRDGGTAIRAIPGASRELPCRSAGQVREIGPKFSGSSCRYTKCYRG